MLEGSHWRFVAIVAVLAMIVSVVSGGFNGVGSGTILLRAVIGGVVFAAIGFLLKIIFQKFFPEFFSAFSPNEDETPSHHVNVLVGDDEENENSFFDESEKSEKSENWEMKHETSTETNQRGSFQADHDPVEVAKAIKTMIKKDQST